MTRERLFSSIVALIMLAAFFLSLPVAQPYPLARLGALCCILSAAAVAVGAGLSAGIVWRRSALLAVAGLFWLLIVLSAAWSEIPLVAFVGACTFSALPAAALIGLCVPARAWFLQWFASGAALIVMALALCVLAQFIFFPAMLHYGQVRWPFANPASYAALLMLGFFPALGLVMKAAGRIRALALMVAACAVAGMIIIGSVGVHCAAAGGLILFGILTRASLWPRRRELFILAIVMLAAFLLPVTLRALQAPGERLVAFGMADKADSLRSRIAVWRAAARMMTERPLTGTGPGTFFLYYPQYRLTTDTDSGGFMAHNDPLQFGVEAGVLAPALFFLFLGLAGRRMIRFLRAAPADECAVPAALFCALAALALHAQIDFDLQQLPILIVAGLLLGLWYRETVLAADRAVILRLPSDRAWAMVSLPLILILFILQGLLRSENAVDRGLAALAHNNMNGFIVQVNAADRLAWHRNARADLAAADVPLGVLRSPLQILMIDKTRDLQTQTARLLDQAWRNNPRLVAIPYDRALLAAAHNDRAAEEESLRAALLLDPLHLPSRVMLARLYNHAGRNAQALALLKEGLQWPPIARGWAAGAVEYFSLLARMSRAAGDKATAAMAQDMLAHLIHS